MIKIFSSSSWRDVLFFISIFFVLPVSFANKNISIQSDLRAIPISGQVKVLSPTAYPLPVSAKVLLNLPIQGKHLVEAHWIRPDGFEQEYTSLRLDFGEGGAQSLILWMQFHENSKLSNFEGFSEELNLKNKFMGNWRLEAKLDGFDMAPATFTVVR